MDTKKIAKPINKFLKAIPKSIKIERLILFGSYSQDKAYLDSDIDVFVVSNDFRNLTEDNRLDILYKASRFIKPEIHPWAITPKELEKADSLTTLGQARIKGIKLPLT